MERILSTVSETATNYQLLDNFQWSHDNIANRSPRKGQREIVKLLTVTLQYNNYMWLSHLSVIYVL